MEKHDIAIIGAGPYGLSAAAHLRQLQGLNIKVFGEPMSFWERHMPDNMRLRSPWQASHLSDPERRFTLDAFTASQKPELKSPVPVNDFVSYGHWFHQQVGLPTDSRTVIEVELAPGGYNLTLQDGATLHARRVVIAGGIQPFARRPKLFEGLPASLVSHTSEQRSFEKFRDKDVLVIGAGQSALEAAAFLYQAGAHVEVLIRNSVLHRIASRKLLHSKPIGWMFYGGGDIGPAGISRVVQHPNLFRKLPRHIQNWWGTRAIRAAVSPRVVSDLERLPIRTRTFIVRARAEGERLRIALNDGTERLVDHIVLGTGYSIDVALYPFLSSRVLERIVRSDGYPRLKAGFECSLPRLHFLGAPAAWSFGPLMRFVAGTEFASSELSRQVQMDEKCCHAIGRDSELETVRLKAQTSQSTFRYE